MKAQLEKYDFLIGMICRAWKRESWEYADGLCRGIWGMTNNVVEIGEADFLSRLAFERSIIDLRTKK